MNERHDFVGESRHYSLLLLCGESIVVQNGCAAILYLWYFSIYHCNEPLRQIRVLVSVCLVNFPCVADAHSAILWIDLKLESLFEKSLWDLVIQWLVNVFDHTSSAHKVTRGGFGTWSTGSWTGFGLVRGCQVRSVPGRARCFRKNTLQVNIDSLL